MKQTDTLEILSKEPYEKRMKAQAKELEKWMLICNINPGGPSGGSATQYFVGDFEALCNRINELQNQLEAHHIVVLYIM